MGERSSEIQTVGGAKNEVMEVLYRHAAISEVAVIGLPDPKWIEAVTAVIVLRDGHTMAITDVIDHCASYLSSFKIPKNVVFLENLPRNASGKILKRELRMSLLAAAS